VVVGADELRWVCDHASRAVVQPSRTGTTEALAMVYVRFMVLIEYNFSPISPDLS